MYVQPVDFDNVSNFLGGISAGYWLNENEDPLDGLSELIYIKFGAIRAVGATGILKNYLAKDDKDAVALYLRFIDELFEIKELKGGNFIKKEFEKLNNYKIKRKTNLNLPKYK